MSEKVSQPVLTGKSSRGGGLLLALRNPRELLRTFKQYFGLERKEEPVHDRAALGRFLQTRASFVAQTSLYGYLRTRAGQRYPDLFEDEAFVASINIAKWQLWLACLGDLAAYAGGALRRETGREAGEVGALMRALVDEILDTVGVPVEAGGAFPEQAARLRERIAGCDWCAMSDDEGPFSESPGALVRWAPVIDSLKDLDEPIVRNSVRFRWQEVRRELRCSLDAARVMGE